MLKYLSYHLTVGTDVNTTIVIRYERDGKIDSVSSVLDVKKPIRMAFNAFLKIFNIGWELVEPVMCEKEIFFWIKDEKRKFEIHIEINNSDKVDPNELILKALFEKANEAIAEQAKARAS